jgi:thioredoxin-dependent peroxiredoxin
MSKLTALLAAIAVAAAPLAAQQPAAAPAPAPKGLEVGTMAPDFSIPGATRYGTLSAPVTLSSLRGQTVVLAFFPRARTRGCTVQMESYRDRYADLYNAGRKVVVLAVSTDADTTLAAWARELETPVLFGSDAAQSAAKLYDAAYVGRNANARHLYVIDPAGRIVHRQVPFNELAEVSYERLAAAIKETLK